MPLIISEFCWNKYSILSITLVILYFIIHILDKYLQFHQKIFHFIFQLYSNCISMPMIVSECFPQQIFNFINYLMIYSFYHMCYMKISVLYENVCTSSFNYILPENLSTSLFNYIPIMFGCLSWYLSFFSKKSKIYPGVWVFVF